jgi:hypothetical protein
MVYSAERAYSYGKGKHLVRILLCLVAFAIAVLFELNVYHQHTVWDRDCFASKKKRNWKFVVVYNVMSSDGHYQSSRVKISTETCERKNGLCVGTETNMASLWNLFMQHNARFLCFSEKTEWVSGIMSTIRYYFLFWTHERSTEGYL